jgi:hypothetical protein
MYLKIRINNIAAAICIKTEYFKSFFFYKITTKNKTVAKLAFGIEILHFLKL